LRPIKRCEKISSLSFNFHGSSYLTLLLYIYTKEEVVVDPVDNLEKYKYLSFSNKLTCGLFLRF
jgi:hypothetical protein